MENGQCEVLILEWTGGVTQACKVCRSVLKEGKFVIGLHVRDAGRDYEYFLGAPSQTHCGEEKHLLRSFDTEEEAEPVRLEVIEHLNSKGTTAGLPLKVARPRGLQ